MEDKRFDIIGVAKTTTAARTIDFIQNFLFFNSFNILY